MYLLFSLKSTAVFQKAAATTQITPITEYRLPITKIDYSFNIIDK